MTEFEDAAMYFPLEPELPNPREGLGVDIVLQGHVLEATMHHRAGGSIRYWVSTDGVMAMK
jgi:hypothetical protein